MALPLSAPLLGTLAHIFDSGTLDYGLWFVLAATILVALSIEHCHVAGLDRARIARRVALVAFVAALGIAGSAAAAGRVIAQPSGSLLPDLISDPPNPSFFNELNTEDGGTRLVVTFDGYVHNIGEGALDVVGNPQEPQGMKQRVRTNGEWEEVGSPTVRYETDDGHNHFHLIAAIEYVLWDELQGAQSALGSKIGFCLVDSEQMEPGTAQAYSEELDNFCEEGNPSATSLRMGVTPGWRDIYDATTTLQWVDVSNVAPGRYWIGAITDPNDEIVESNEANNDLIFSEVPIAVPGFSPRASSYTVSGEPVEVVLRSTAHGTVGQPAYVIEQGPTFGSINVPVGAVLSNPSFVYTPDAGYEGEDQVQFSVRNTASPYPFDSPTSTVSFQVEDAVAANSEPRDGIAPPQLTAPSTFFESWIGERSDVTIEVVGGDGGPASLHATNLPAGLVANAATGEISGVAIEAGFFQVELSASQNGLRTTQEVTWIVNPPRPESVLRDLADQSTARGELSRIRIAAGAIGTQFEADGLPDGVTLDPVAPLLSGTPREVGTYQVEIRQLNDDDEVIDTTSFAWTIRPTTDISFPL